MSSVDFTVMRLERIETFIYRSRVIAECCTFEHTPISYICRIFGFSPDTIVKRVRFRLVQDDGLPF